jgi:hypothetical protein
MPLSPVPPPIASLFQSLSEAKKTTPDTRVDAINGRMTKKVDIDATWRTAEPPVILPEQSKN